MSRHIPPVVTALVVTATLLLGACGEPEAPGPPPTEPARREPVRAPRTPTGPTAGTAGPSAPLDLSVIEELGDDVDPYEGAARVAGLFGRPPGECARLLGEVLADPRSSEEDIWAALRALRELGPEGLAALAQVLAALQRDPDLREPACAAIGAMGAGAASAVPALRSLLAETEEPPDERWYAVCGALADLGPDGATVLLDLHVRWRGDTEAYNVTLWGLIQADPEDVVPRVLTRLQGESDPQVTVLLVDVLYEYGSHADGALPLLIELVAYEDEEIVNTTISTLREMGHAAADAVPALVDRLRTVSDDDPMLPDLIDALGVIGAPDPRAAVALGDLLVNDGENAHRAADALRNLGAAARPALPDMLRTLVSPGLTHIQIPVLDTLMAVGPEAEPALPRVLEILRKTPYEQVRISSLRALVGIGARGEETANAAREVLDREAATAYEKLLASVVLHRAEGDPDAALRTAREAVATEGDQVLRSWGVAVIGLLGPGGAGAATDLAAMLDRADSADAFVTTDLITSLRQTGPPAAAAIPALLRVLDRPGDWAHHTDAVDAAVAIGLDVDRTVTLWSRLLRADDDEVRALAVQRLGTLGPSARGALPLLRPMTRDPSWRVRHALREALPAIGE